MSRTTEITTTFVRDGVDLTAIGDYTPGSPAVMYLSNGDPGHPGEDAEVENVRVELDGVDITDIVTDAVTDAAEEAVRLAGDDRSDCDGDPDDINDARRDRDLDAA